MLEPELLEPAQWRGFRLFLRELEDREFNRVAEQLKREIAARRECDGDITRLFFSSLAPSDLETARQTIQAERLARTQDRRRLARSRAQEVSRQRPRRKPKPVEPLGSQTRKGRVR